MEVRVRVPTQLRDVVDGASSIGIEVGDGAVTVADVLDRLATVRPALERRLRDEAGHPRVHVNLFVGDDNIRDLDGLDTSVPAGTDLSIIPAVSGG